MSNIFFFTFIFIEASPRLFLCLILLNVHICLSATFQFENLLLSGVSDPLNPLP